MLVAPLLHYVKKTIPAQQISLIQQKFQFTFLTQF